MSDSIEKIMEEIGLLKRGKVDVSLLRNVEILLEESNEKDIVFYSINDNEQSSRMFYERLRKGNPGLVVFNQTLDVELDCAYAVAPGDKFFYYQKRVCDVLYPINLEKNKIVGITGTNGKTSVCHFLSEIFAHLGYSTLAVGTIGAGLRTPSSYEDLDSCGLTTPSYLYLRKLFFIHRNCFDFIVMELSSHGLDQDRLGDIKIDLGIWTNFTQDHLDYHESIEHYFMAKAKIFHYLKSSSKVLVHKGHDEIMEKLDDYCRSRTILFDSEDLISYKRESNALFFKGFMLKNVGAAFFSVKELLNKKVERLDFLTLPPGRFHIVGKGEKSVVVDYAHTPDALENLICLAKSYFLGKKINVLFGCGGERDKKKRAKMGEVVQNHASKIYITSDNPRSEDPEEILSHIEAVLSKPFVKNVDRKETIRTAINEMKKDEVLLVAGKGHECYQEICGVKYPFDDREVVKECLND